MASVAFLGRMDRPMTLSGLLALTLGFAAIPKGLKFVADGTNAQGRMTHSEWTLTFDRKEHPVENAALDGAPDPTDQNIYSASKIDDYTIDITIKNKNGITVSRNLISKDGRTRTATRITKDAEGRSQTYTLVYEKQ